MKTQQLILKSDLSWEAEQVGDAFSPQLILVFGDYYQLKNPSVLPSLQALYPEAMIAGCSTAGEISGEEVWENSLVATAIELEKTRIQATCATYQEVEDSFALGECLSQRLLAPDLGYILVFSDGQLINGSQLIAGMQQGLQGAEVMITGGMAGDSGRFEETLVACGPEAEAGKVVGIGFYGKELRVASGSMGGWDAFGPERQVTRSQGNLLYELDHRPALQLYKQYLGEDAEALPGSALLFPLMVKPMGEAQEGVVRTILNVDEEAQTMTFAGDIPEGYTAKLMMANIDRLIEGAAEAGKDAREQLAAAPELAILVSCVGRKMVLGQRVEDEVEAVAENLSPQTRITGMYSYGEMAPGEKGGFCELHNQTMTITLLSETS
jgi:hypothetical protein